MCSIRCGYGEENYDSGFSRMLFTGGHYFGANPPISFRAMRIRDEALFENPDTLDLTRTPNKHLAFGKGIHYCPGAPLARLEAQIAFRVLLERAPNLQRAVPESRLRYKDAAPVYRLEQLPVILTGSRQAC